MIILLNTRYFKFCIVIRAIDAKRKQTHDLPISVFHIRVGSLPLIKLTSIGMINSVIQASKE